MKGSAFMYSDICTDIDGSDPPVFELPSSTDEDLYLPTGCFMGVDGNIILFDSGCSMEVSPYKFDVVGGFKFLKGREM